MNYCKECENAKDLQKYRPLLFCSKHRTVITEHTIPNSIKGCKGKDYKLGKRKTI